MMAVLPFRDWWSAFRDRRLTSPDFQRWAARFPFTRPIARRRARSLFDLCAGFVYSQVLLACVRLKLFKILEEAPLTAVQLAHRIGLSIEATERLVAAAVALELIERRGQDRIGLGPHGAALLGNPGLAEMVEHHAILYADLRDPVALLKGEMETGLGHYWPYAKSDTSSEVDPDGVAAYSALMSASQPMVSREILDAYPFDRHRTLLDVGGGEGTFLAAAAARAPQLNLMLFDLPPVVERARARFEAARLSGRAQVFGGNFYQDELPKGADLISLIRVVHDHDDAEVLTLLKAVRRALPADGTLLLAEPMAQTRGAEPMGDAYFGFYLLAMGSGRPRSFEAIAAMLRQAGFGAPRALATKTPLLTRILVAHPEVT